MNRRDRMEMFVLIKQKMDEIMDIVRDHGLEDEFLTSYCFGLAVDVEETDDEEGACEFFAGFSAADATELAAMITAMEKCYTDGMMRNNDNDEPTDSIDYWLNK